MEFILMFLGLLIAVVLFIGVSVHFSMKRDEKKYEQKKAENQARLSRIKEYLDSIPEPLTVEQKQLIFKLKNRWEIIYKWMPIRVGSSRRYQPPMHPQGLSACADRDAIEVQLMDMGIQLEYPN